MNKAFRTLPAAIPAFFLTEGNAAPAEPSSDADWIGSALIGNVTAETPASRKDNSAL